METRYKLIANNVVFLIFAFVGTKNCASLILTDGNVCPRRVTVHVDQTENETVLILECCPNYFNQNGKCQVCPAGTFGKDCFQTCKDNYHGVQCRRLCNCEYYMKCDPVYGCVCNTGFTGTKCSNACQSGSYGVNCSKECFCAHNAECNPVTGDCLCTDRWFGNHCTQECPLGKFGIHCSEICDCSDDNPCEARTGVCISGNHESECHQGYYDFNLKYNCSETCACNDGATCNKHTGICECEDKTSCININKKQIPKDSTSTIYINRPLFIVVVTLSISIVCVLLLALTYMLFGRYLNHTTNRGSQHNGNETQIVHGHYNESNHYSEIRDDQLHDIRRTNSGMVENDLSQNRFQQTPNGEHQNNVRSLLNINILEEQHNYSYCSLHHENDDYLNPYCALRFERRANSCIF